MTQKINAQSAITKRNMPNLFTGNIKKVFAFFFLSFFIIKITQVFQNFPCEREG